MHGTGELISKNTHYGNNCSNTPSSDTLLFAFDRRFYGEELWEKILAMVLYRNNTSVHCQYYSSLFTNEEKENLDRTNRRHPGLKRRNI